MAFIPGHRPGISRQYNVCRSRAWTRDLPIKEMIFKDHIKEYAMYSLGEIPDRAREGRIGTKSPGRSKAASPRQ